MILPPPLHLHLEATPSTMEAARREAPGREYVLVTAATQTGGRGTKGRAWHSPRGNLYLTLAVHRRHLPPESLRILPLEAGLALWDAVAVMLPPPSRRDLKLKWPNDLLWEGRKTAGMLLEAASDHVFIGVGINIVEAPEITDGGTPSGRLFDAGITEDAGSALAPAFAERLRERLSGGDPAAVLPLWRERAEWNRPLRLRDRPGLPEVFPVDINAEGHLRVRFADGREEWLVSDSLA